MSFLGALAILAIGAGATKVGYDRVSDFVAVHKVRKNIKRQLREEARLTYEERMARLFCKISEEEFNKIVQQASVGIPRIVRITTSATQLLPQ
jgi:hypothetical protein